MRMSNQRRRQRGFTLIEMIIVVSIVLILVAVSVPNYQQSIIRARETVLRQDLYTLRSVINQYTEDKQKAPQSLEDLISAGYLKVIPKDPITSSNTTWQVEQEDVMMSVDQTQPGITDVRSGSSAVSSEGTAYNTW